MKTSNYDYTVSQEGAQVTSSTINSKIKRLLLNVVMIYAKSEHINAILPSSWTKRLLETVTISDQNNSATGSNLTGYDDFTPSWYTVEGSNILLGMYARAFIIIYVFLIRFYLPKLCRGYDQRWKNNREVTR